jgi:hypothetical protein
VESSGWSLNQQKLSALAFLFSYAHLFSANGWLYFWSDHRPERIWRLRGKTSKQYRPYQWRPLETKYNLNTRLRMILSGSYLFGGNAENVQTRKVLSLPMCNMWIIKACLFMM